MDKDTEREFREWVVARQDRLLRVALLLTGHREDAEDLLQGALTKLALHWKSVVRSGSPDAYVRKILYHQNISRWRVRRHRSDYLAAELPEQSARHDLASDTALRLSLAAVLAELTPRQRAVIVLRYYEDLPEARVAEVLNCSIGTVRSRTHRAVSRLRRSLSTADIVRETTP
jgi:RNA polymerase sigma-70 factor (sigma-E family)